MTNMTINKYLPSLSVIKLFLFVGFVWAALVGPISFVLILTEFGATSSQIGIFSAVSAVLSMVFQPVWGMISDKIRSPRRVLCFCLVGSLVFFGSVFFVGNLHIAIVLLLLDVVFRCGIVGLLDSHTIAEVNAKPSLQYGHIRMAGSIFFGLLSFAFSRVTPEFGVMAIIPVSAGITLLAICWGLFLSRGKSEDIKEEGEERERPSLKRDALSLLVNLRYIVLILFIAVSALALQPLWVFMINFAEEFGGDAGSVFLIQSLRCVVELPLFIFIGIGCKKVSSQKLMIIGLFFMFVYVLMLLFANSLFWVFAAHLVGGTPGFIFGLTGRLRYLNEVTPNSVRSTSITLMGTVELGLGAILGNLIAGFLLDSRGIQGLMVFTLSVLVVASVILGVLIVLNKRLAVV